jgi:tripartite-type tricarboxylate transporter receptor subunit TctC
MPIRAVLGCFAVMLWAALTPSAAKADEAFPTRPITFIVPWGPGGGADQLARTGSKLMEPLLKVSLPVINVPGATGQTGLSKLLTSPADGYSIEVMTGDTFALFAGENPRFKASQLMPLAIMIQQPSGFFVKADSPWKTWDDVQKAAATQSLRVAVTGFGSPDDMTVNYFRGKGMKLESVPFPEPGLRYASVVGGQSDLLYEQAGDVRSFLDGKQIRPVIFFSKKAFASYPDIPYSKQLGYDVTLPQFRVVIARAGTDPKRAKVISDALAKVAAEPEYAAYLKQQLGEPESYVPADQASAYMSSWLEEANALASQVKKK